MSRKMLPTIPWAAAMLIGALALTGCGASQGTSPVAGSSDTSAAQKVLDEAQAKVTKFDFPTEQVAAPKDKFVVGIPCSYSAEGCKRSVDGVADAAKHLGWRYQMIDPAGDPEKMRAAVKTAIQIHADAIVLGAIPPNIIKDSLAAARSAGIKVINMLLPAVEGTSDANVGSDWVQGGRWNAAYITVATKGAGKVISINDPEFDSVVQWHQGFTDGLKELCSGCQIVKDTSFQIANLQTQVPTDFQAILQANPTANAVWTAYDPVALAIDPVIKRSAQNGKMTVVSQNGDPGALQAIKAGDQPFKATIGVSVEWQSYAAVDQIVRLFDGNLPGNLKTINVPQKLISAENVTTMPWDGDLDWKSEYLKLWKTS